MQAPELLYLQLPQALDAHAYRQGMTDLAEQMGATVLGSAGAAQVECLEAGTPPASVLLVQFNQAGRLAQLWDDAAHQDLLAPLAGQPGFLALQVNGLPYVGLPDLPDIPTIASVTPPEDRGPRAFMVVQGTGTDPERMERYRDLILPMIAEQGAYYIAFDIEGGMTALQGEWPWAIFAISRWPDHAAGHAFWDSERYQTVAKPMRAGAGEFHVHFFTGSAG